MAVNVISVVSALCKFSQIKHDDNEPSHMNAKIDPNFFDKPQMEKLSSLSSSSNSNILLGPKNKIRLSSVLDTLQVDQVTINSSYLI